MNEYLTAVLTVSAFCSLLFALAPAGEVRKSVRTVLALVLLYAVIVPLGGLSLHLPAVPALPDDALRQTPSAVVEEAVFTGITAALCEHFGISSGVRVGGECETVGDTVLVRRATLHLSGRAKTADAGAMLAYLRENTGAVCEVIYDE